MSVLRMAVLVAALVAAPAVQAADLFAASRDGDIQAIRDALDGGAAVNARDDAGYTPLMWAARHGHFQAVKLLCARGADVHATNRSGRRAAALANMFGYYEIGSYLRSLRRQTRAVIMPREDAPPGAAGTAAPRAAPVFPAVARSNVVDIELGRCADRLDILVDAARYAFERERWTDIRASSPHTLVAKREWTRRKVTYEAEFRLDDVNLLNQIAYLGDTRGPRKWIKRLAKRFVRMHARLCQQRVPEQPDPYADLYQ